MRTKEWTTHLTLTDPVTMRMSAAIFAGTGHIAFGVFALVVGGRGLA